MAYNSGSRVAFGDRKYLGGAVTVYGINHIELVGRERLWIYIYISVYVCMCVFKAITLISGDI